MYIFKIYACHKVVFLLLHKTLEDANHKYHKLEDIQGARKSYKLGLRRFMVELLSSGLENAAELKASLFVGASRCARRLGQQKQAESLASQALNLKPCWFHAFYARAKARAQTGKVHEALQVKFISGHYFGKPCEKTRGIEKLQILKNSREFEKIKKH